MSVAMAKDRKAIDRVRHDYDFLSQRRGMLAITVDLDDAKRILELVDRLETRSAELERDLAGLRKERRRK